MLKLQNIVKVYQTGGEPVIALKGVSLEFRKNEFVSILGPSGCGKTTMLNIIGGLDRYTDGDLSLDGKSTRGFLDGDWDAYRNNVIGMVFQSYNLIPHLSVLENVSIALTLSGIGAAERKERARAALESVGLESQLNKRPNQLSGGQMQRVAIARALVNDPDIILADEPTGALDSRTSEQVLEILKKISENKLVIMVTHNEKLAETYSDRIVKLEDGQVVSDTAVYENGDNVALERLSNKKTSMGLWTAIKHSFKNLMTKKARTILTAIAGSIGIMGIAIVLSISNGMQLYIDDMQRDMLAGFPITVSETKSSGFMGMGMDGAGNLPEEFPDSDKITSYTRSTGQSSGEKNVFSDGYIDYLNALDKSLYNSITYNYGVSFNVLTLADTGAYKQIAVSGSSGGIMGALMGGSSHFSEMPDSTVFLNTQYEVLASLDDSGKLPENMKEAAIVVDSYNRLNVTFLEAIGVAIKDDYTLNEFIGREFKVLGSEAYYKNDGNGVFKSRAETESLEALYNDAGAITVKITAILRVKETATTELLSTGVVYTNTLTKELLSRAVKPGSAAAAQLAAGESVNVLTGEAFNRNITYESVVKSLGAYATPTGIQIYPVSFAAKDKIKDYLDAFNKGKTTAEQVDYSDLAESISSVTSTLLNYITIGLAAFAGVSLVVSSIMIGIITYVSVVERTKEIGILRAIGARKKDISRLFNAETLIIGFAAGALGILVTLLLSIPANLIINALFGISSLVVMPWWALALIALSMLLTLVSGLFPSGLAAKRDPVRALRTE